VLVDAADLSTLGNAGLLSGDGVAGELTTAHAQQPARRGRLINLVSAVGGAALVVAQDPATLVRTPLASLAPRAGQSPLLGRPWVHEFPCAGRWAVVPEGSLPMDLVGALTGQARHFMFSWVPGLGTRYHVVDLGLGPGWGGGGGPDETPPVPSLSPSPSPSKKVLPVAPYIDHPDPNFYFHVVNAFVDERAREFVFDVPAHADASMLDVLSLENLRSNSRTVTRSRLTRVRVPLLPGREGEEGKEGEGAASPRPVRVARLFADSDLDSREPFFFEFPSPNPRHRGKAYRFAWGLSAVMPTSAGNALAKVDVSGGEGVKMWFEPGCLPGEPLMVPRPHGKEEGGEGPKEDDGVVLSLVIGADGGSFLLILDAESMDEVARAELGAGLPYGFHCCWVDKEEEGEEEIF
jgi:carlactone synthase/all-trans-10'-apo-beta-carotenal 13,14-cleaving dioxygenase